MATNPSPVDADHATRLVRSSVAPLDKVPVAVKGRVWPWVMVAVEGDTEMEVSVGRSPRGARHPEPGLGRIGGLGHEQPRREHHRQHGRANSETPLLPHLTTPVSTHRRATWRGPAMKPVSVLIGQGVIVSG